MKNSKHAAAAEQLHRALDRATAAALMAIRDGEDGGTCNFDAPALEVSALQLTRAEAEDVIRAAGLRSFEWKPFRGRRENGRLIKAPVFLTINGFQRGQGNLRTRMSEAFCESLRRDGIPCGMYYQMD